MKFLTEKNKKIIYPILSSSITLGVLVFALLSINEVINNGFISVFYLAAMFFFLSLSRVPLIIKAKTVDNSIIAFVKYISFSAIYLGLAVATFFVPEDAPKAFIVICSIYFFTIVINRVCKCFENKKPASIATNTLLALISLMFAVVPLIVSEDPEVLSLTVISCIMVIMILALIDTLVFAFSRMQLKGIIKIMKKTYAFEILYGLVVLIVACSFYFTIMEDSIPTFADGLWYSFAIVTTIGFGDFTVVSLFSRILSVILGIYGLIVVAVITSVIVNFYNEVKDKKDDDTDEKDK